MFKVRNFHYNGFCGQELAGYTSYTAEFLEWTNDPGVAKFQCSDGKIRLIPTFALEGDRSVMPKQDYQKLGGKVLFGAPTQS